MNNFDNLNKTKEKGGFESFYKSDGRLKCGNHGPYHWPVEENGLNFVEDSALFLQIEFFCAAIFNEYGIPKILPTRILFLTLRSI